MKRIKSILSILLVLCMAFALASCAGTPDPTAAPPTAPPAENNPPPVQNEPDTPPPPPVTATTKLVVYQMGDPPSDQPVVTAAINEKLQAMGIPAELEFQFSTWTDFQNKYAQELMAGTIDMIYVANWIGFWLNAANGAFLPLNDLLDQYAPALKARETDAFLNQVSINGQIYCVPGLWPEYTVNGVLFREDLRAKYNLPVPDTYENMEAYFKGIMDNEPDQPILYMTTEEAQGLNIAFDAARSLNIKYPWTADAGGMPYGIQSDYNTPDQLYEYWKSQAFIDDCKMFKRWADMGFWSRSALSATRDDNIFRNGGCVAQIAGQNAQKFATSMEQFEMDGNGWQSDFYNYGETTGIIYPAHASQNGTAIVRTCKNPELAMQVINAFMTNEELNHILMYGIEGQHYELNNGIYDNTRLQTNPEPFQYEGFNTWNYRVNEYRIPRPTDTAVLPLFDKYAEIGKQTKFPNLNIWEGFSEDYADYQAERAAVREVMTEYLAPLQAGLVSNVEASVTEFLQKVEEAGLQKCRDGFTAQWLAYCDAYGYKG